MNYAKNDMCRTIETYANKAGFSDIRCYVVTQEDGVKEYAICDDKQWLYGSPSSEAIAVHIDILKLTKEMSDEKHRKDFVSDTRRRHIW
jgi:hypothetical protein